MTNLVPYLRRCRQYSRRGSHNGRRISHTHLHRRLGHRRYHVSRRGCHRSRRRFFLDHALFGWQFGARFVVHFVPSSRVFQPIRVVGEGAFAVFTFVRSFSGVNVIMLLKLKTSKKIRTCINQMLTFNFVLLKNPLLQ